jgi:ATP-dependent RNA helicase SUPV3L1/SUV3
MILSAISKQFTLQDDGQIFYQSDSTNPLPGEPLAIVRKGESLLIPDVEIFESRDLGSEDRDAVKEHVSTWLKAHIYTILEPLFGLISEEEQPEIVRNICLKLFAGVGIIPRGEIEDLIAQLDTDMRKMLRDKKVRLGPLLVFIPDLNKPAAVRLRGLLWSLSHDAPLPAPVPKDGSMSVVVDVTTANPDFYRAIGYPLYGPRVIRIDMLDRVINAVYDGAKGGKFQAQHSMAEWMGCPIADLYAILEAMGHKHIETPVVVEVAVEEIVPVAANDGAVEIEVLPVSASASGTQVDLFAVASDAAKIEEKTDDKTAEKISEKKAPQKKPELDFFFLRRGKAHSDTAARRSRVEHENKPAFPKERYSPKNAKKSDSEDGEHKKFKKKKFDDRKKDKKESRYESRVFSADAVDHDNPFAVLQNLKLK